MRRSIITAALGGLIAAAAFAMPAQSAENASGIRQAQGEVSAQARKRAATTQRTRPRIAVTRRSYLNTGTESMPGDHKYQDYAFPLGYSVTNAIDNTGPHHRHPLPGPFDLPSRRNPF